MRALIIVATMALGILAMPSSASFTKKTVDTRFVGFWELDFDEDGTQRDTMEFTADGRYVMHGTSCEIMQSFPYHVHRGDLFVALHVPGKGPIAMVFHRNKDGRLSFTSPRTRQNAYYKKLTTNPCIAAVVDPD